MAQATEKEFVMFGNERIGFTPKKLCVKQVDFERRRVKFYFRNGRMIGIGRDDVQADTWDRLALHGLSQKCGDEGAREDVTTADAFYEAVLAMKDRLIASTAFTREAGERIPDRDLYDALVALGHVGEDDEALGEYKKLTAAERNALKTLDDVREKMADMAKERSASVDTSGLLAKFKK